MKRTKKEQPQSMAAILHSSIPRRKAVKEYEACVKREKSGKMKVPSKMVERQHVYGSDLQSQSKSSDAGRPARAITL